MVSFRNSQFQAILNGMVIADAVSHGQLSWNLLRTDQVLTGQRTAGSIADSDWCHAIAAALTPSTTIKSPATLFQRAAHDPAAANVTDPSSVAGLLTGLPLLLINLDRHPPKSPQEPCSTLAPVSPSVLFYDCLQASLRQDAVTLAALGDQLQSPAVAAPLSSSAGLSAAIETVLAAQGDFQVAVGQSLQSSIAPPGSTVLTAIFSAGWGDLPSLPTPQLHGLKQPHAALQVWLQQRWHMTSGNQLSLWAAVLWQQWSGQHPGTLGRSPMVAIQPLAALS